MTDRPILFSAPMIRAILREIENPGKGKTQTRRILKPQPPEWATYCCQPNMLNALHQWVPSGLWAWSEHEQDPPRKLKRWPIDKDGSHYWLRPRFQTGDRLWVREAWRCNGWATDVATIFYAASEGDGYTAMCEQYPVAGKSPLRRTQGWRPSIHMPRWISRVTLIVTDVRVERLRDISEADAIAEGAPLNPDHRDTTEDGSNPHMVRLNAWTSISPIAWYHRLWDEINGTGAWDVNPWVVAYSFRPILGNIDQMGGDND